MSNTAKEMWRNLPEFVPRIRKGHWFSNFEVWDDGKIQVYIGYENGDGGIIEASHKDESFDLAFEKVMKEIQKELKFYDVEI